jgi:serine/threonine protein phosphatase PrpC
LLAGGEFFGAADRDGARALDAGGQDNITSVLVKVEATEE